MPAIDQPRRLNTVLCRLASSVRRAPEDIIMIGTEAVPEIPLHFYSLSRF
eukprot:COSAG01_NODE_22759_length_842_cov_1.201884_1_plen_50_part_00